MARKRQLDGRARDGGDGVLHDVPHDVLHDVLRDEHRDDLLFDWRKKKRLNLIRNRRRKELTLPVLLQWIPAIGQHQFELHWQQLEWQLHLKQVE